MMRILHIVICVEQPERAFNLCRDLLKAGDLVCINISNELYQFETPLDLQNHPNYIVSQPYIKISPNDYSYIDAIFHAYNMCKYLLEDSDFVNVLSGYDVLLRPITDFRLFLITNPNGNFIRVFADKEKNNNQQINKNITKHCTWPKDINYEYFVENHSFISLERKGGGLFPPWFGLKRFIKNRRMSNEAFGAKRFTLTRRAMEIILEYVNGRDNKYNIKKIKKDQFAAYHFWQSIVMEGTKFQIVSDSLSFEQSDKLVSIKTNSPINSANPEELINSNAFFYLNPTKEMAENLKMINK